MGGKTITRMKLSITDITSHEEKKEDFVNSLSFAIVQGFCLFALSYLFLWNLESLLRTDKILLSRLFFYCLCSAIYLTLLFHLRYRVLLLLASVGGLAIYIYMEWDYLLSGAKQFLNLVIAMINPYYRVQIGALSVVKRSDDDLTIFFCAAALLVSLFFACALIGKRKARLIIASHLLVVLFGLTLGRLPAFPALFLDIIILFAASAVCRRGKFVSNYIFCLTAAFLGMALCHLVGKACAPSLLAKHDLLYKTEKAIENEIISGSWYYDIFLSGSFPLFAESPGALNNYRPNFSNINVLKLTVNEKPLHNLYLKEWTASEYMDNHWKPVSEENFLNEASRWNLPFKESAPDLLSRRVQNITYNTIRKLIQKQSLTFRTVEKRVPVKSDIYSAADPFMSEINITKLRASNKKLYTPYFCKIPDQFNPVGDGYLENTELSSVTFEGFPLDGLNYLIEIYMYGPQENQENEAVNGASSYQALLEEETLFEREYREYVYKEYLKLPAEGLEQLRSLCREQWKYLTNIYGIISFIHTYLAVNTEYSTNLDNLPAGEDFVEYFLFRQKKGFCTHYATAATLMFRMFGIPARYVSGYVAPPQAFTSNKNRETYDAFVEDKQAHAWTEIYINGFGWYPIETTPGYSADSGENSRDISDYQYDPNRPASTNPPEQTLENPNIHRTQSAPPPAKQPAKTGNSRSASAGTAHYHMVFFSAFLSLFLVLVLLFLLRGRNRRKEQLAIYNADNRQAILYISRRLYSLLVKSGRITDTFDNDEEYASYVDGCFPELAIGEFNHFLSIARAAAFSPSPPLMEDAEYCRQIYHKLKKQTYQMAGKWRRFLLCFLYGMY